MRILWLLIAGMLFVAGGCDSASETDHSAAHNTDSGAPDEPPDALTVRVPCKDSVDAVYMPPASLPAFSADRRGDILRCAVDRTLSVDQLRSRLEANQLPEIDVRSSLRAYRITYRTERLAGQEGLSSALLLLPDHPIALHPPLLVFAHGSIGTAPDCALSKSDVTAVDYNENAFLLWLAGYGYPLIMPDYAGYVGGPPPGFQLSEDEAHSLLDSTRAIQKLLRPGVMSDQVVMVGHSQGGHAVLSAQAIANAYGLSGQLLAVIPMAPAWYVARTYGAIISAAAGFKTDGDGGIIGVAIQYFFTHAELYDGKDSGYALFQPSARAGIAALGQSCGGPGFVEALGATTADFFDPTFLDSISACGLAGDGSCETGPAAIWWPRFRADRPHIDPQGAEILLWQGAQDALVAPPLAQCGIEKITMDLSGPAASTKLTICGDRDADHQILLDRHVGWVARWIAARTLGEPEPEACPGHDELLPDDGELTCLTPPGNAD
jgi:hypothetical protein